MDQRLDFGLLHSRSLCQHICQLLVKDRALRLQAGHPYLFQEDIEGGSVFLGTLHGIYSQLAEFRVLLLEVRFLLFQVCDDGLGALDTGIILFELEQQILLFGSKRLQTADDVPVGIHSLNVLRRELLTRGASFDIDGGNAVQRGSAQRHFRICVI